MLPVPYTGGSGGRRRSSDNVIDAEWREVGSGKTGRQSKSFRRKVEEKVKKAQDVARKFQGTATGKYQTRQQMARQQRELRKRNVKKIAAAREVVESQAMGYQESDVGRNRPTVIKSGRGIVEASTQQVTVMDMMLPGDTQAIRNQRSAYLAEPERFKTHRTYGNFDFIGKKSKRGATDWKYDTDEMFR